MTRVFLCYEMDNKTGIAEVKEVSVIEEYVKEFLKLNKSAHRVEEHYVDGHKDGKSLIRTFYSEDDWG